jgi:hypothetical protein
MLELWNEEYAPQRHSAAKPQPKKMDITTKHTKSTKEENIFFWIRCPLRYPVFVLLWLRVFAACANFAPIPN